MNHEFESDQDYMDSIAEEQIERDPAELDLEETPEALGMEPYSLTQWAEDERAKEACHLAQLARVMDGHHEANKRRAA